jgi:hypothetical protein
MEGWARKGQKLALTLKGTCRQGTRRRASMDLVPEACRGGCVEEGRRANDCLPFSHLRLPTTPLRSVGSSLCGPTTPSQSPHVGGRIHEVKYTSAPVAVVVSRADGPGRLPSVALARSLSQWTRHKSPRLALVPHEKDDPPTLLHQFLSTNSTNPQYQSQWLLVPSSQLPTLGLARPPLNVFVTTYLLSSSIETLPLTDSIYRSS